MDMTRIEPTHVGPVNFLAREGHVEVAMDRRSPWRSELDESEVDHLISWLRMAKEALWPSHVSFQFVTEDGKTTVTCECGEVITETMTADHEWIVGGDEHQKSEDQMAVEMLISAHLDEVGAS